MYLLKIYIYIYIYIKNVYVSLEYVYIYFSFIFFFLNSFISGLLIYLSIYLIISICTHLISPI